MLDILNPFKKQKLTVTALSGDEKSYEEIKSKVFEAMFNPSQYSVSLKNDWQKTKGSEQLFFASQNLGDFDLELTLDGTGVSESVFSTGFGFKVKTVKDRIKEFLEVCYFIDGDLHRPNYVKVHWGDLDFIGYLHTIKVTYTLFDASGTPLRAKLATTFKVKNDKPLLSSPDLTHTREVHAGDTLPLLSKEIYGSSRYYLFIAEANKLDDFRNLKPGTKLYFPPLENQI